MFNIYHMNERVNELNRASWGLRKLKAEGTNDSRQLQTTIVGCRLLQPLHSVTLTVLHYCKSSTGL